MTTQDADTLKREIFAAVARISRQPYHVKRLQMILEATEIAERYKSKSPVTTIR